MAKTSKRLRRTRDTANVRFGIEEFIDAFGNVYEELQAFLVGQVIFCVVERHGKPALFPDFPVVARRLSKARILNLTKGVLYLNTDVFDTSSVAHGEVATVKVLDGAPLGVNNPFAKKLAFKASLKNGGKLLKFAAASGDPEIIITP